MAQGQKTAQQRVSDEQQFITKEDFEAFKQEIKADLTIIKRLIQSVRR